MINNEISKLMCAIMQLVFDYLIQLMLESCAVLLYTKNIDTFKILLHIQCP